jgi:hypothetical protein
LIGIELITLDHQSKLGFIQQRLKSYQVRLANWTSYGCSPLNPLDDLLDQHDSHVQ